ncbi:MAG: hypothetical protein UY81_C0046G0006 [Candidatus Giovannonibacteria bacterium GW2011_GWA2_53_7]|uniref:Uncharacterized protein n=1 Tax=Candidatus Giovannonibacteria bacterium GW2011_GWA2_53_7 TaxID=1618650 RepID=A0A0G1XVR9_9BACT|nr:MAG: hypothetical protein UY81_C0046G0006 [Candidatus Giovannonibacteria bacterium GW2011_GWA2_53_7]
MEVVERDKGLVLFCVDRFGIDRRDFFSERDPERVETVGADLVVDSERFRVAGVMWIRATSFPQRNEDTVRRLAPRIGFGECELLGRELHEGVLEDRLFFKVDILAIHVRAGSILRDGDVENHVA